MTIINETTIVVFNYTELKQYLEGNNTYTYFYLGEDITLTNGITINMNKSYVIIDETYNNITHTLTDKKSASASDTISASNKNILQVTVKNLKVIGYNYYGVVYAPERSTYKNIIIEYNNIEYVGPQICFHHTGLTRFIDCNITIQDSYAVGNEVADNKKTFQKISKASKNKYSIILKIKPILSGVYILLVGILNNYFGIIFILLIYIFSESFDNIMTSELHNNISSKSRVTVESINQFCLGIFGFLFSMLMTILLKFISISSMYIVIGGIIIAFGLLDIFINSKIKKYH